MRIHSLVGFTFPMLALANRKQGAVLHEPGSMQDLPDHKRKRNDLFDYDKAGRQLEPTCMTCGHIYSGDFRGRVIEINLNTGESTHLFNLPSTPTPTDIAITAEGNFYYRGFSSDIYQVDMCTQERTSIINPIDVGSTNGMCTYGNEPDILFIQNTRLARIDVSVPEYEIVGSGEGWCGSSKGDLVYNPTDGLLYSALECYSSCSTSGTALVTIDPFSGDQVTFIGCITENSSDLAVYGLTMDNSDRLIAGTQRDSDLFVVDPITADATRITITGDYSGTWGLDSMYGCTETTNESPVALCKNEIVASDGGCASMEASIDNGSYDPDGDLVGCSQDQSSFEVGGPYVVTLTCTDTEGETDLCTGNVTVLDTDTDDDGVDDCDDKCPDTDVPESVPTRSLGNNRWALTADGDGYNFDTSLPKGKGSTKFSYSISDTVGCSCEQIIDICGYGNGQTKFGCSNGVMEAFTQDPPQCEDLNNAFPAERRNLRAAERR